MYDIEGNLRIVSSQMLSNIYILAIACKMWFLVYIQSRLDLELNKNPSQWSNIYSYERH